MVIIISFESEIFNLFLFFYSPPLSADHHVDSLPFFIFSAAFIYLDKVESFLPGGNFLIRSFYVVI